MIKTATNMIGVVVEPKRENRGNENMRCFKQVVRPYDEIAMIVSMVSDNYETEAEQCKQQCDNQ